MRKFSRSGKKSCEGAVLILAMIFLVLLGVLVGSSMQMSTLRLQMSGNAKFQEEAFQQAHSIVQAISDDTSNFITGTQIGSRLCKLGDPATYCDTQHGIAVDQRLDGAIKGVEVNYSVERMGPLLTPSSPVRLQQAEVSSSLAFSTATFEVHASVDGSAVGLGRAEIVQGIAMVLPSAKGNSAE